MAVKVHHFPSLVLGMSRILPPATGLPSYSIKHAMKEKRVGRPVYNQRLLQKCNLATNLKMQNLANSRYGDAAFGHQTPHNTLMAQWQGLLIPTIGVFHICYTTVLLRSFVLILLLGLYSKVALRPLMGRFLTDGSE